MRQPNDEESAQSYVQRQWMLVHTNRSPHFIIAPILRNIEEYLDIRQKGIEKETLEAGVDWARDLYLAKSAHKYYLDFSQKVEFDHKAYIEYWKTICSNGIAAGEKLSLAGLNTIYLVHGAVAVGSLNALASKGNLPTANIVAAAKFAMPCALAGIGLVGVGQIIVARYLTEMSSRVAGKLVGTVTNRRARSFSRYWSKYQKRTGLWGDRLIYGSVVWFFVYSIVSYLILIGEQ